MSKHSLTIAALHAFVMLTAVIRLAAQDATVLFYFKDESSSAAPYGGGIWLGGTYTSELTNVWGKRGDYVQGAYFSPDGKRIAFNYDSKLYIMNNNGADITTYTPEYWPPDGLEFSYTAKGIFWTKENHLRRFVPETGTTTTVSQPQTVMGARCYLSKDATKGYVINGKADAIDPNPYDLSAGTRFYIMGDFDSVKVDRFCPTTKKHKIPIGTGVWGHGNTISPSCTYVFHQSWYTIETEEKSCPFYHSTIGTYNFDENVQIAAPCAGLVANATLKRHECPEQVVNSEDHIMLKFGNDKSYIYAIMNWRDRTNSKILPVPDSPVFRAHIGNAWLGTALPSPTDNKPLLGCGTNELIFSSSTNAVQNVVITNIGDGTLGAINCIKSADAGWLRTSIENNGTNSITVANTVAMETLPDGEYNATVYISGGGADNQVSYTVTVFKGESVIARPTRLVILDEKGDMSDVLVRWMDNSDNEQGFKIERSVDNGDWTEIASTGNRYYHDLNAPKKRLTYRVRAYNGDRYSGYSNEAWIAPPNVESVKITNPVENQTLPGGGTYTIQWNANLITNVKILYSTDNGLSWETITETGGIVKGATNWANFVWNVPAVDKADVFLKVADYEDRVSDQVRITITTGKLRAEARREFVARSRPGQCMSVYDVRGALLYRGAARGMANTAAGQVVVVKADRSTLLLHLNRGTGTTSMKADYMQ